VTDAGEAATGSAGVLIHAIALVFSVINATIQLLVPLYALYRGYSPLTIGVLAALPSVANVTLRLVFGRLSDRHGEAPILQVGGLIHIASALSFLLSTAIGLAPFVLAQLLQGVARSIFWTVGQTYVTKLPLRGGLNLGLFNGAGNLGMLIGMSGAGFWALAFGYRGAFAIVAALAIMYTGLTRMIASPPSEVTVPPRAEVTGETVRAGGLRLRPGPLWLAAACSFVSGGTWAMAASFYPVYLSQLRYNDRAIGLLVMLMAAGMLGSSFASRHLAQGGRAPERFAFGFIVASGVGMAAVPAFQDWRALAVLLLAIGFGSGACSFIYQLMVQQRSTWEARGSTMASIGLFGNLALFVLPTGIGLALTWISLRSALALAGLFLVALGAVARMTGRDVGQRAVEPA
jgi:MFS family permease